jgi:hypothetical protein
MRQLPPSPLRKAVADLRAGLLQTWVLDAVQAYSQAALLIGHHGDTQRLRQARIGLLQTRLLVPAYEQLLARHAERIGEGRQLILPWESHEEQLQRHWCTLVIDFVRNTERHAERAQVQRWVLQASIGLAGPVDRQTAADLLLAAAAEHCA